MVQVTTLRQLDLLSSASQRLVFPTPEGPDMTIKRPLLLNVENLFLEAINLCLDLNYESSYLVPGRLGAHGVRFSEHLLADELELSSNRSRGCELSNELFEVAVHTGNLLADV